METQNGKSVSPIEGLLEHHYSELRRSGLSDDMIRAAGIYSETAPLKLATLLDWKKPSSRIAPALIFPYTDAAGRNGYARAKPDNPRLSGEKPVKYESPRGQPNQPYLPPGVAKLLDDPTAELLITEGEKKSLCATQHFFPCIGLVGVFGWKEGKKESLLPALERITWKGRRVFIAFDSDIATNENVQDAENRLAFHLGKRGAIVRVVRMPEGPPDADGKPTKMGLDDFLVAEGPAALRRLLDSAEEPTEPSAEECRRDAGTLDATREAPEFLKRSEKDGVFRLRFWNGEWWLWTRGAYSKLPTAEVRAEIGRYLSPRFARLGGRHVSDVMELTKAGAILTHTTTAPAWLDDYGPFPADEAVVCRNGMARLSDIAQGGRTLLPLTPRLLTHNAIDCVLDFDTPLPEVWLGFLHELWEGDAESQQALQEWFGLCLVNDTRYQKILGLFGPPRSGKGVICRVLRELVGRRNVVAPTLDGLSSQFGLWGLIGKSLAIISDARLSNRSNQATIIERLLSISGEDAVEIHRKCLEPITVRLPTRLMLVSNELPRLGDSSGAFVSRLIVLQTTESFLGREDQALEEKLRAELPGILRWAIEGWASLRERGRFKQPAGADDLLGEMRDLASPIGAFVRDCCIVDDGFRCSVADLFGAWRKWCEENGRREPGTQQSFGRDLRAYLPRIRCRQPRDDGGRHRVYDGVGIRGVGF